MNLFDVVLAICMLSDPSQCREHRLQFESMGTLQDCIFDAQFYIAQWQQANPDWKVGKFHCEYPTEAAPENPS